jgi:hypothetical protein
MPLDFEKEIRGAEKSIRQPESRARFIKVASRALRISPDEVERILLRPWGVRSITLIRLGLKKYRPCSRASVNKALAAALLFFYVMVSQSFVIA